MCNMHIYVYTASLSQTRHMERSCSHEVVTKVYASLFVHNPYERETCGGVEDSAWCCAKGQRCDVAVISNDGPVIAM